ncbi:hypothetical protein N0V84_003824 [Fusarium piperis]|uniref:Uncharacterized protein n=1 Tax=Fusarium piperis TaxID=1435070 RepID=A0A9W9BQC6_9HYPO|nr:hypothetical protein N0V84_003824 [Fusarium piperis]
MLRSELCIAVGLLKEQVRQTRVYIDHYIYPAYFQNGKVVVRPSRLINLYTTVITPEVRLVIRWLNSRAVGETRLPISEAEQSDDLVPVEVVADEKGVSSEAIHVQ